MFQRIKPPQLDGGNAINQINKTTKRLNGKKYDLFK
jgi:hypothetical protein